MSAGIIRQISHVRGVILRHNEDVTGIDGLDVHERHAKPTAKDEARR